MHIVTVCVHHDHVLHCQHASAAWTVCLQLLGGITVRADHLFLQLAASLLLTDSYTLPCSNPSLNAFPQESHRRSVSNSKSAFFVQKLHLLISYPPSVCSIRTGYGRFRTLLFYCSHFFCNSLFLLNSSFFLLFCL